MVRTFVRHATTTALPVGLLRTRCSHCFQSLPCGCTPCALSFDRAAAVSSRCWVCVHKNTSTRDASTLRRGLLLLDPLAPSVSLRCRIALDSRCASTRFEPQRGGCGCCPFTFARGTASRIPGHHTACFDFRLCNGAGLLPEGPAGPFVSRKCLSPFSVSSSLDISRDRAAVSSV